MDDDVTTSRNSTATISAAPGSTDQAVVPPPPAAQRSTPPASAEPSAPRPGARGPELEPQRPLLRGAVGLCLLVVGGFGSALVLLLTLVQVLVTGDAPPSPALRVLLGLSLAPLAGTGLYLLVSAVLGRVDRLAGAMAAAGACIPSAIAMLLAISDSSGLEAAAPGTLVVGLLALLLAGSLSVRVSDSRLRLVLLGWGSGLGLLTILGAVTLAL